MPHRCLSIFFGLGLASAAVAADVTNPARVDNLRFDGQRFAAKLSQFALQSGKLGIGNDDQAARYGAAHKRLTGGVMAETAGLRYGEQGHYARALEDRTPKPPDPTIRAGRPARPRRFCRRWRLAGRLLRLRGRWG